MIETKNPLALALINANTNANATALVVVESYSALITYGQLFICNILTADGYNSKLPYIVKYDNLHGCVTIVYLLVVYKEMVR